MAENRFKMRIYRIFRSCKSKYHITNDVVESTNYQLIENCPVFDPQKSPVSFNFSYSYQLKNPKIPNFYNNHADGRKCPPASPIISPIHVNFSSTNSKNRGTRSKTRSTKYNRLITFESDEYCYDDMMSLAVVKRSRDPYSDFRASMVEMIVENEIFGARDLSNLLRCFLSLNSCDYHGLILEVFDDISKTLLRDVLRPSRK